MTTPFTWGARLLDAAGNPAAGATLAVELFDLASGKWIGVAQATTTSDGSVKARGEIADDTLPFAPAMRLVEGGAVMATTPAITRAARGLNVDFGEVQRVAVATAFARSFGRGAAPFRVGGGSTAAAPAVDMSALRAEVGRDFTAALAARDTELADNRKLVNEKDAEVRRLGSLLAARDQEIGALRAQPAAPSVDVAAVRAQLANEFASRIAAKEQDVADRDKLIAARDDQLADRIRQIDAKDAEIKRLIADRERISINPDAVRPDAVRPGGARADTVGPEAVVARKLAVNQLANSIGTQLDEAQTSLKSRGFSLGAIEINAKGLLAGDGTQIEIPDREAMKTLPPGVLSDFKLSFQPDPAAQDVGRQTVPDLAFLTENRVRAVLASLGLVLDASTGPATLNPQAAAGQAMLQTPAPGTAVPRGGRVAVIFAAPKP